MWRRCACRHSFDSQLFTVLFVDREFFPPSQFRRECPEWIPPIVSGLARVAHYVEPELARPYGRAQVVEEEDGVLYRHEPNGVQTMHYFRQYQAGLPHTAMIERIIGDLLDDVFREHVKARYTIDRVTRAEYEGHTHTLVTIRWW